MLNERISREGALSCFCMKEIEELGNPKGKTHPITQPDGSLIEKAICKEYYPYISQVGWGFMLGQFWG